LRDGAITLAAQVLFGQGVAVLPQCQLRLARFRGIDKRAFLDQRQLNGHAFQLLEEAILFCQRHLSTAARIPIDRLEREEQLAIPLPALREALVNALCHRDYSQQGAAISLAIFDDRLEIWSEGGLPFGLEPEELKQEHASRPRNLLIADVFFRRGLIERWGRGTQVIVEECQRAGCSEPSYRVSGGCFVVTFPLRPESGQSQGQSRGQSQSLCVMFSWPWRRARWARPPLLKHSAIVRFRPASTARSVACWRTVGLPSRFQRNRTADYSSID
jgi:ATP-dependent DNA helicase RecG